MRCYRVALAAPTPAAARSVSRWLGRPRVAAAVLGLLVAAAAVGWWLLVEREPAPVALSPAPIRSLAVLPLENLSGDLEQEYSNGRSS